MGEPTHSLEPTPHDMAKRCVDCGGPVRIRRGGPRLCLECRRMRDLRGRAVSRLEQAKAEIERLKGELLRLTCIDTTPLADITDLLECKILLQRERERSYGLTQEIATTGYGKEVDLRRELEHHRRENERLRAIEAAARTVVDESRMSGVLVDLCCVWLEPDQISVESLIELAKTLEPKA